MQHCLKGISSAPADLNKNQAGPQGCSTVLITAASGEMFHPCTVTPSFKDHDRMNSKILWYFRW